MNNIDHKILRYGVFYSTKRFPNTVTTADRMLDCFEIELYTDEYPGTAYINGSAYKLEKGLVICGKPGQYRHSHLHFNCCFLHLKVESPELYELLYGLADTLLTTDYDELSSLFCKMSVQKNESVLDSLFLHSCSDRILYLLIKNSKGRALHPMFTSPHIKALSEAKQFIKSNYTDKLSLKRISKKVALSPVYFHKLFTEYYDLTPTEYTLQVRISVAKQLLIATDISLTEIAEKCGFSSQSYFNYNFKKQTGMSPLKYRKQMRNQIDIDI